MKMTLRDAARFLGLDEGTLEKLARKREIPAHQDGDRFRFNRVELLEWATARDVPVKAELLEEPDPGAAAPLPGLADAVRLGGIHAGVRGDTQASVLRAVVDLLPNTIPPERELLYRMLLARETLGSTAMGQGIAIPHPRNPIVLRVEKPMVAVCFLERHVDFDALDAKPVHTALLLVSPSIRVHLHLLALIATAIRDQATRELLERRAPAAEILAAFGRVDEEIALRRAGRAGPGAAG
jgi:PTS system nitrogen regulatory IIA component